MVIQCTEMNKINFQYLYIPCQTVTECDDCEDLLTYLIVSLKMAKRPKQTIFVLV